MNGYLIPANAKKGTLIFNIFRPFDLLLFCVGVGISLIAVAIVPSTNLSAVVITLLPGGISVLLVWPIPNYHNVLCAICSIYNFYTRRRRYIWKGWCFYERFKKENAKSAK